MPAWNSVASHPARDPVALVTPDGAVPFNVFVDKHIPEARDGYWYYNQYYFGSGHLQTILSSGDYEHEYPVWYGRRLFRWSDGAQVSVDYAVSVSSEKPQHWDEDVTYLPEPDTPRLPKRTRYFRPEEVASLDRADSTQPLLISLHGLTGGSHENYLRATICEMAKAAPGFECIVLTSRGCNRSKITTPQLFNAAWTEDLRLLVKHIVANQPHRPIYLVGYSLGASILVNYLGQEGENLAPQVKAASPVSAPWDLKLCSVCLSASTIGRNVYDKKMASNLVRLVRNNRKTMLQSPAFVEKEALLKSVVSVEDFDDAITAPLFGFTGSWDYYRAASCVQRLGTVRTPTLIINAQDDPIVGDVATPYADSKANPFIHLLTTANGGHLGWFMAGTSSRWYALVVAKFFTALNEQRPEVKAPEEFQPRWFRDGRFQVSHLHEDASEPLHT